MHGMIEVIREPSQSNLALLLFLGIVFIYIFLHNSDSRRFVYFFRSLYNKQYQISYGRYNKVLDLFNVLFSLSSILSASFLLSFYMENCSRTPYFDYLYIDSVIVILSYIGIKWITLFLFSFLIKQQKIFIEFSSLSVHYANLFFTPIAVASMYLYLVDLYTYEYLSVLMSMALTLLVVSRVKVFVRITGGNSFEFFHIILYLCVFELAPFLWLLFGLNC